MRSLGDTMKQLVAAALAWSLMWSLSALAMAADPPSRVGRITLIEGTVKFYADQEEGWQPAQLNFPVTSENSLWTERRGRAEWRVGPAAVRLDHDTVLDVQKLDDTELALYVQRGAANIRVGLIEKGEVFRIFTPESTVTLRARGSYRIEADMEKGETRIAVLAGRARVESTAGSPWIEAGRMALLERNSARVEMIARTEFDDWAQARDEKWEVTAPAEVSPYMTGYEELNTHGTWESESEYGRVWVPRVVVDWAPYRYGHWRHVRPWGWTWIDDAPWGFAPMHYGRWVHVRGRWAWWPGNRIHRPVWSPALVAWVGGSGWSVSYSTGAGPGIGWFPLAPYEAYVPWYRHSPTYVYNINHIHINRPVPTRPPRHYANHKPGVTVVSPTTFQAALPVASHRGRVSGEAIWNQPVVQEGVNLPPRHRGNNPGAGYNPQAPAGKPAVMQPAAPSTPAEPRPMPRHVETQRPDKPRTGFAGPQSGPKPGVMESATPTAPAESMPSRQAPASPPVASQPATSAPVATPQPQAPVQRSEPQPRYTPKPRTPVESSQTRPELTPAPVTREVQREAAPSREVTRTQRPERIDRGDRPERVERVERPRAVESSSSRPAPAAAPAQQSAPAAQAPRAEPKPKPAPAPRESREKDETPQPERVKNPGRTQER